MMPVKTGVAHYSLRMTATAAERRLIEHVDRIEAEQPPIALETVDFTVMRPDAVRERFGPTLDYLARVELEVDRNVLELNTMLADPPEIDVRFYREVWHAQEIQHGVILDRLQTIIGRPPASPDTETVSAKMRILGAISHFSPVQDITRMLYYLTGMSTERSAVLAYNKLHAGMRRARREGAGRHRRRADPPPGAAALRLLQALRDRPRREALALAEVAGPTTEDALLGPGRCEQPRAEGRTSAAS